MGVGEYIHIGLEKQILKKLKFLPSLKNNLENIVIDIHTDGMSLHQSNRTQVWPIQLRVINLLENDVPSVIGVYAGNTKPQHTFLQLIIDEFLEIHNKNGIEFQGKRMRLYFRALIADAPARALVLNHRGHNSTSPCSKCKVVGQSVQKTMCFVSMENVKRTDEEYLNTIDINHHISHEHSLLTKIQFNMVTRVPFKYMHLICLGVVKNP